MAYQSYLPKTFPCFSNRASSSALLVLSDAKFATKTREFKNFGSLLMTGRGGGDLVRLRWTLRRGDLDRDRDRGDTLRLWLLFNHGLSSSLRLLLRESRLRPLLLLLLLLRLRVRRPDLEDILLTAKWKPVTVTQWCDVKVIKHIYKLILVTVIQCKLVWLTQAN